jgi:alkylation response protein AidB-like acyl-CoA dehydrogenase
VVLRVCRAHRRPTLRQIGEFEWRAGAELVLTSGSRTPDLPAETARTSTTFTIFEGTSEIQRMIIGRAVTGLDVR